MVEKELFRNWYQYEGAVSQSICSKRLQMEETFPEFMEQQPKKTLTK